MKRPASVTLVQALISPDKNSLDLGPSLWSCLFSVFDDWGLLVCKQPHANITQIKPFLSHSIFLAKDFACIALISFDFNFVHFKEVRFSYN